MGAITNLDGAGTARALASIKAELDKRQREFAKYGVNNINGYMSLYKGRFEPKEGIVYPDKPLPHLVLVSDEFAELKANVPEFLDELTSVARIGRSLGVHLILATQKPSGVVNDQIEANSRSKIALKMASTADSNELLKTPDAASITNPGRGYLKVGENEVYEMFQSGYAGIPYDPDAEVAETVDERIYSINDYGQYELLLDPSEDVKQGHDTSDLPTELEAVIDEVNKVFEKSEYVVPDKPWLPNMGNNISVEDEWIEEQKNYKSKEYIDGNIDNISDLSIPLGLLDLPKEQSQEVYNFDIEKIGSTAIFGSPGYGKSTILQSLVLNYAYKTNPIDIQFNLLDFGTNGLLPLKDLPNVIDIVTLEEDEKLEKMMRSITTTLATRKKDFKEAGVATIKQYENKTNIHLPVIINILDSYDGLTSNDNRKDKIDDDLLQVLREGSSLGVYLIMTASRAGAIQMRMMSNIPSKMVLYLNDADDVSTIMGREKLQQQAINGRGQVFYKDVPTSIQFYLPTKGETSSEVLNNLEKEVEELDSSYIGERPSKIPMVPENLTEEMFSEYVNNYKGSIYSDNFEDEENDTEAVEEDNKLYLGLNKEDVSVEYLGLFEKSKIGIFPVNKKQLMLVDKIIENNISNIACDIIVIDVFGYFNEREYDVYISSNSIQTNYQDVVDAIKDISKLDSLEKHLVIFNGISLIIDKLNISAEDFFSIIENLEDNIQVIMLDLISNVGKTYNSVTSQVKENVEQIVFGGEVGQQTFVDIPYNARRRKSKFNELIKLNDDVMKTIVMPQKRKEGIV
jgi:S-DNA-T family DNA segregation ATPase FtsK/SpoIIIE